MKARAWIGLLTLATLTALAGGCGGKTPVLGVLLPTSGTAAAYGESMANAIRLALDKAEEDGTAPEGLSVVWADSATDPDTAVREFRNLVKEHGVHLVVGGGTSAEARALLPVLEETQVIHLSASASAPSLTKDSPFFYRVFASDALEGIRAGTFLYKEKGCDSVVIVTANSEHSRGIEPEFRQQYEENLGGQVVGRVVLTDANWQQQLSDTFHAYHPKAVYVVAYAEQTLEVIRFLRRLPYPGVICATSAFFSGRVLVEAGNVIEEVFFPQPPFDPEDDDPLVQDFVKRYREQYGSTPDIFAAHAYDAMRVALKVLSETPYLDITEIKKTIQFEIQDFPGVTGIITFDDYGDVRHNPIIYFVKDGEVRNFSRYQEEEKRRIMEELRALMRRHGS